MKILVLLFVVITSGCIVYPAPWKKESYVSEIGSFHIAPPDMRAELAPYFVGEAFVSIFFRSINETSHSGGSPFRVFFSILGDKSAYEKIKIHSINICSKEHGAFSFETEFYQDFLPKMIGVKQAPFEVSRLSDSCGGEVWFYTTPIEIDTQRNKIITVILDIEVRKGGSSSRKTIHQEFRHKITKGFWSWNEI